MVKRISLLIVPVVLLALILQGCAETRKPAYFVGSTWEVKGNTFCVENATWIDDCPKENGVVIPAEQGWVFLKLSCKMILHAGWELAGCSVGVLNDNREPITPYVEPIPLDEAKQQFTLLFRVSQAQVTELNQYVMTVRLRNGSECAEEYFYLYDIVS